MTFFAIILVLVSACMHASWNLICKSRRPSGAFFLIATVASIIAFSPITIYCASMWKEVPVSVWMFLIITGSAQALYYIGLGNAYRLCEVSLAYPLARALPVLFVPTTLILFGDGGGINDTALLGMGLVTAGCVTIPMNSSLNAMLKEIFSKGYFFILMAAVGTTGYTIIDSSALRTLIETSSVFSDGKTKTALMFITLENLTTVVFLLIYVASRKVERDTFKKLIADRVWQPLTSGVICSASYTIILLAMMFAANVSYIAAFRQISIPLGAILGILIFKEKITVPKLAGITLLCVGLLIVALY